LWLLMTACVSADAAEGSIGGETQTAFRFVAEVLPCWPRSRSKLSF
jgi:hypothetical protein